MPDAAVVTSVPDGSARTFEWRQLVLHQPAGYASGGVSRGGKQVAAFPGATNWGLGGEVPTFVTYKNGFFTRIRQGAAQFGPAFAWCNQQPTNRFSWRQGLYVFEGILAWPTNTAAVDNGFFITNNSFQRVITQAQAGFGIWNDNGVCKWTNQGAGRTDFILNTGGSDISEPFKFRIEMRNATADRVASVAVLINDVRQVLVQGASLPVNVNAPGWFTYIGVLSATEYCYFRDFKYFAGPDTSIGM